MNDNLYQYILQLSDNSMILGHRLSELCGHGPSLETDIALTNISLDLYGQTRSYCQYAAKVKGENFNEDTVAFLRTEREYKNVLLVEQPNTDFAYIIVRQFLFDAYHLPLLEQLKNSKDKTIAAIAAKSIKEVSYHHRFSSEWVKRLGDGTEESHQKTQEALDYLWAYVGELFEESEIEKWAKEEGIGADLNAIHEQYKKDIEAVVAEATLTIPEYDPYQQGGKNGIHSEHMGFILTELQYMQRTYPNMTW